MSQLTVIFTRSSLIIEQFFGCVLRIGSLTEQKCQKMLTVSKVLDVQTTFPPKVPDEFLPPTSELENLYLKKLSRLQNLGFR